MPFSYFFFCVVLLTLFPVRIRVTVKVLGFGLRLGSWLRLGLGLRVNVSDYICIFQSNKSTNML